MENEKMEEYNKKLEEYEKKLEEYNNKKKEILKYAIVVNNTKRIVSDLKRFNELVDIVNSFNGLEDNIGPDNHNLQEKTNAIINKVKGIYNEVTRGLNSKQKKYLKESYIKKYDKFGIVLVGYEATDPHPDEGTLHDISDFIKSRKPINSVDQVINDKGIKVLQNHILTNDMISQAISLGMLEVVNVENVKFDDIKKQNFTHILVLKNVYRFLDEFMPNAKKYINGICKPPKRPKFVGKMKSSIKPVQKNDEENIRKNEETKNEELKAILAELEEEIKELWQSGVHENTPDAERYHAILAEKDRIEAELRKKNKNPFKDLTDEQLVNKLKELEGNRDELYHFYAHMQNGMEQNDDSDLDKIDDEIKRIKSEIERREKDIEKPESPIGPGIVIDNKNKSISEDKTKQNEDAFEDLFKKVVGAKKEVEAEKKSRLRTREEPAVEYFRIWSKENKKITISPSKRKIFLTQGDESLEEEIIYGDDSRETQELKELLHIGNDFNEIKGVIDHNIVKSLRTDSNGLARYMNLLKGEKQEFLSISYDLRNIYNSELTIKEIRDITKIAREAEFISAGNIMVNRDPLHKRFLGNIKKKIEYVGQKLLPKKAKKETNSIENIEAESKLEKDMFKKYSIDHGMSKSEFGPFEVSVKLVKDDERIN